MTDEEITKYGGGHSHETDDLHKHSGTWGYAKVWICSTPDCGFIGFHKPEADTALLSQGMTRKCPNCERVGTYLRDAEGLAKIEMVRDKPKLIMPRGVQNGDGSVR